MSQQSSRLDFRGQTVYVGLDVHKRSWKVAVYVAGRQHKRFSQEPDAAKLARYLTRHFPGAQYQCVYEAGCFGFWIHDALMDHGLECVVVSPADVPTKDKERRQRNDRVDAAKLARGLAAGELTPIYVAGREQLEARSLVRTRHGLVRKQTRCKNQIRGLLTFYGIEVPEPLGRSRWSRAFVDWLYELEFATAAGQQTLRALLDELVHLRGLIARVTRELRLLASQEPYRRDRAHLLTVPGVGPVVAMTLLVELIDIRRFPSLDHLASYVGLVPSENSSGEQERTGSMTPRRNRYLRWMLIEASWIAVAQDPALLQSFIALTTRMKKTRAIVRIARKLLNRIRYVLHNQQPYEVCVVA